MARCVPSIVTIALVATLSLPARVSAAAPDGGEPPPTGRGLIIAGGVVGGVGVATMIAGGVVMIVGRNSREGMASAIGGIVLGTGAIALVTGIGLLAPGLVRHDRYREYEAQQMDRSALGPGGFVVRF